MEEALSIAENNLYRLSEEKRELEVGKTHAEQELQKALEEASSQVGKLAEVYAMKKSLEDALSEAENKISTLMNEKEDAQLSRAAAETELEKAKEEVSIQYTKLSEAFRTVKSLADAMSQVETNVSLLSEENNNIKVGRNNLESAMKQLKEEADSQASKLADANSTIKSLEEALLKAENNISELVGEKQNAEEEISALNSKVNACMEELAGTNGSLESRSLELSSHVNNLQLLLKDEILVSLLRRSFETKFETLKDMDLLLEDIKDHFVKMESETHQSYPITETPVMNILIMPIEKAQVFTLGVLDLDMALLEDKPADINEYTEEKKKERYAVDILEVYITEVERQLDRKVKIVRSDMGGQYYGKYDEYILNFSNSMADKDRDGFNPLHLAAIKGKVEVLRELVGKMPQAALPKLNH
ncbi:unnamed protein product [Camellia sinensis]